MDDNNVVKHFKDNITLYVITILLGGSGVGLNIFNHEVDHANCVSLDKYEKFVEAEAHYKDKARKTEWENHNKQREAIQELQQWKQYQDGLQAGRRGH